MTFYDDITNGKRQFSTLEIEDISLTDIVTYDLELTDCVFRNVSFRGARLEGLQATRCHFENCIFAYAELSESKFVDCVFYKPAMECSFHQADCRYCEFITCDMRLVSFEKTRLFKANFLQCNATGANFYRAAFSKVVEISECIFELVDLRDAQLPRCNLSKTSFRQADLREANFEGCNLQECDFAGASLAHMTIQYADMRGANIAEFDVRSHSFFGVQLYEEQAKALIEKTGAVIVEHK